MRMIVVFSDATLEGIILQIRHSEIQNYSIFLENSMLFEYAIQYRRIFTGICVNIRTNVLILYDRNGVSFSRQNFARYIQGVFVTY